MKKIEIILDECIDQIRAGSSIDNVLVNYPDQADELRKLLGISQDLEALPDPALSVEGLMTAITQQISKPTRTQERRQAILSIFFRPALLRFAASIMVVFLLGWGTVAASSDAVPGNFMYPVKRFAEKIDLMLSLNDKDEAELRITFSERRLSEALKTYQQGGGINDELLLQMLEEAKQALNHALALTPDERSYLVSRVGYLTAHQKNVLETVKHTANPQEQADLEPISELCGRRMQWMGQMIKKQKMAPPPCAGCWTPTPEIPLNDLPKNMQQWMDSCPM